MLQKPKKIIAIHDLSGFGRCALTVILPTISAMGIQPVPVPTAVLSTHTGYVEDVAVRDLTDFLAPTLTHYQKLGLDFDCIYTGFLNSEEQIGRCLDFFQAFPHAMAVVDPVMGDHGRAYRTYTPALCRGMESLVRAADLITPNITEAAMLLHEPYPDAPLTHSMAKSWLCRLAEMGPKYVVITSVSLQNGILSNIGYDAARNAFWRVDYDYIPVAYPGTGDIYTSVIVGGILSGDSLPVAMDRAARFLEYAIMTTYSYGEDVRHGVMLEPCLHWLTQKQTLKSFQVL